jgi:hypothetical protein
LHCYHLFPLFLCHIFDFFYSHDPYFFDVMIHLLKVQWLHYCVSFDHLFQLFLALFLWKHLLSFLIYQVHWLVGRTQLHLSFTFIVKPTELLHYYKWNGGHKKIKLLYRLYVIANYS